MLSKKRSKTLIPRDVAAGAAIYSDFVLSIYDVEVLFFEIPLIFKCPLSTLKKFYLMHVSGEHLEVGVGTGFFPAHSLSQITHKSLHLLDLNSNTLKKTANRLKIFNPVCHQHNVFNPLSNELPKFSSIAIMNFLHCLPGTMLDKESVIINLKKALKPNGVIFGATALGEGVDLGYIHKKINRLHNKIGIFTNHADNICDLEKILKNNFQKYFVESIGAYALFYAYNERPLY